ncbi:MAG: DNA-processing protein DprA [Bacteroidales bacterium]|nr:MAG: DNA-processing protein DprA [Bacteroidales bacterium]
MNENTLKYKIGIGLIPKIGPVLAKRLVSYCGSIEGVFREKSRNLSRIPGIGEKIAGYIVENDVMEKAEKEVEFMIKNKIKSMFFLDDNYPERLKHCYDAPVMIFVKGETDFNREKILCIVGTRNATNYGRDMCNKLVEGLAVNNHNVLIISGLAYGIDICAHRAALSNNLETAAVLGHGHAIIYPPVHYEISRQIISQGALISEFPGNERPERGNFVRRNRIIAGLSDATVVVESGEKGGALITADIAGSYDRDVFAFPGKVNDRYSAGCNKLIKTHRAALIENYADLEYILGWQSDHSGCNINHKKMFAELTDEENKILNTIETNSELTIDQVSTGCHMPVSKVSALLLNLEFKGLVECLPGKLYKSLT